MKIWEALEELKKGKKIRIAHWPKHSFLFFKDNKTIFSSYFGREAAIRINMDDDWEIYDDREEVPKHMEWLKELYAKYSYGDICANVDNECEDCPLGIYLKKEEANMCETLKNMLNRINNNFKLDE